jgi:hypothetical protein
MRKSSLYPFFFDAGCTIRSGLNLMRLAKSSLVTVLMEPQQPTPAFLPSLPGSALQNGQEF